MLTIKTLNKNLNSPSGLTFIEVMLATCIFSVAIVGLLALFTNCLFLAEKSKELTVATTHAEYVLEQVRGTNFSSIVTTNWSSWAQSQNLLTLPQEQINVNTSGTNPLTVTTTVSWAPRFGTASVSVATMVTQ